MPRPPRIACLLIPDLPLRAELRAHPEGAGRPLVILSGREPRAEVVAASDEAVAAGIGPGCPVQHARALCPELIARVASPALERAARAALVDVGCSLAPRVEISSRAAGFFAAEAALFVDASGIDALHAASPGESSQTGTSEANFATRLQARAERQGLPGVVTVASSRGTALLVARHAAARRAARAAATGREDLAVHVLAPGDELRFLEPLSIDLLDPDDATASRLTRFGIRTIRGLLGLPRKALAQRFGPDLQKLVARARGEEIEPPLAAPRDDRFEEGIDLDDAVHRLEGLAFVLRGLVDRLIARLELRGLGCTGLDLELDLEDGRHTARRVGVAAPSLDERVLLRLLRLRLERDPPTAAVVGVRLTAKARPLRSDQLDLFLPAGPDPVALDQKLTELDSLCAEGNETDGRSSDRRDAGSRPALSGASLTHDAPESDERRVGAPRPAATHHPRCFGVDAFFPPSPSSSSSFSASTFTAKNPRISSRSERVETDRTIGTGAPPVRALRPPVRAQVHVRGGRPDFIRSPIASGEIVAISGPWRTTGLWWSEGREGREGRERSGAGDESAQAQTRAEGRFALDQYDVQVSNGMVLRLCYDWTRRVWQIDAVYD